MITIIDAMIGFDPVSDVISEFITLTESAVHTYINVDRDGQGTDHTSYQAVRLENVTGEWSDIDDMITSGSLIVA